MATSEWLTPAEAGGILGVGPDRIAQLVRQGVLPAMRTPGGHVRIRRDKVEGLANPPEPSPTNPPHERGEPEGEPDEPDEAPAPGQPEWQNVPPWKRKEREAQADLRVQEFDDQREQLLEARLDRHREREQAKAQQAVMAVETDRLRKLRSRGLLLVSWNVPQEERAKVARYLDRVVTSDRYPIGLGMEHVDPLLRTDIDRALHRWRDQEAAKTRNEEEARNRKRLIDSAVAHARLRAPNEWDWNKTKDFERAVRQALKKGLEPGTDQDDADGIAFAVLDEWLEAEEGDLDEDEFEEDDEYEDESDD